MTTVLVMAVFLTLGWSNAKASDREDEKELVGWWESRTGVNCDEELKGDGTYRTHNALVDLSGTWEVKNGKLIIKTLLETEVLDFKLSPDSNTLTLNKPEWIFPKRYTRKKQAAKE
jgi:hypothetical protein